MPNKPKVTTNIQDLPPEVLEVITSFSDSCDHFNLRLTCCALYNSIRLPLIRLHLNGPRSNGNQRGMTANETYVFTGLLHHILQRPIANNIVSVSISTDTVSISDIIKHIRLISKLPQLEMLKIGPEDYRAILHSELPFLSLKVLALEGYPDLPPREEVESRINLLPNLTTFFSKSGNYVYCTTKKRDYISKRIKRSRLHRIEQYCTELFEDSGPDKPNYMREVHELLYHDEGGITLSWADNRKLCRRIKVQDVHMNVNRERPHHVDPRDAEYEEYNKYTTIFGLHGNHTL
ncbi:hypothetical protein E3Q13_04429 [Wallemia mellicola]|nr:hypothetical protein E3Q13_04429 [Wallemia mellicola]